MAETILSIAKWHEETFPDATLEGQLQKYQDEQLEWVVSNHKDISELADMFIVACGIARFDLHEGIFYIADVHDWWESSTDIPMSDLTNAINKKMKVNRNRKWNKVNGNYQHVEE